MPVIMQSLEEKESIMSNLVSALPASIPNKAEKVSFAVEMFEPTAARCTCTTIPCCCCCQ
uniref:plantazolicin family TOMM peptide n=1 Tax=Corynebacterium sanguinis TaxID=2594913 RepID=UPI0035CD2A1F